MMRCPGARISAIVIGLSSAVAAGCGSGSSPALPPDAPKNAGPIDAPVVDAALVDAALVDAALVDAAPIDAALIDAQAPDAALVDAQAPDAALIDAQTPDAAIIIPVPDAALVDAQTPDAALVDAQTPDAAPAGFALTIRTYPDTTVLATGVTANVTLLALQDGDGPWTALTGTNGVYHATVQNQRYAVAVGCAAPDSRLTVFYQTVPEGTDVRLNGCFVAPDPAVDPSVTVSVHSDRDPVILTVGSNSTTVPMTNGAGSATITTQQRIADVFALNFDFTTGPDFILKVATFRGPTLDLTGVRSTALSIDMALAHPLEEHPITVVDVSPDGLVDQADSVASGYFTVHSSVPQILITQSLTPNLIFPTSYGTVDAASRQPGDIISINPSSSGTTASGLSYQRDVFLEFTDPAAVSQDQLSAVMPSVELADVVPTVDFTGAVPRGTIVFPLAATVLGFRAYQANFTTTSGNDFRLHGIAVSPAWAQGASSVSVTPPDLSQLPGWTPEMELAPGLPVDWTTFLDDRNMPYNLPLTDGKRVLVTQVSGEIQPPAPAAVATVRKPATSRLPGRSVTRLVPMVGSAPLQRLYRAPRSAR